MLSLYIHLPWCVRKCPYCDFNSHAAREALPVAEYTRALLADLALEREKAPDRPVETVFIGGGTPSLFPPDAIGEILDAVRPWLAPEAEITLEANPGTVELERFRGFRAAGVTRLSIGIQSFDENMLRRLGRIHGRSEALEAADAAREAGFRTFNLDLMYALPEQRPDQAVADLEQLIALAPPHVSHYQLTLEPNTVFHARPPRLPDNDTAAEMQHHCQQVLADAGYGQYETSAYARDGHQCRHNLNYWRFGDYLAAGAGAHGKLTHADGRIRRYRKVKVPALYMARMAAGGADTGERWLTSADCLLEFMMNALRLNAGFDRALFESRTGLALATAEPALDRAMELELLEHRDNRYRPTRRGRDHLDTLVGLFLEQD